MLPLVLVQASLLLFSFSFGRAIPLDKYDPVKGDDLIPQYGHVENDLVFAAVTDDETSLESARGKRSLPEETVLTPSFEEEKQSDGKAANAAGTEAEVKAAGGVEVKAEAAGVVVVDGAVPAEGRTGGPFVTSTLIVTTTIISSVTTFASCYTTLAAANLVACSNTLLNVVGGGSNVRKGKRSLIEDQPIIISPNGTVMEVEDVIKATKVQLSCQPSDADDKTTSAVPPQPSVESSSSAGQENHPQQQQQGQRTGEASSPPTLQGGQSEVYSAAIASGGGEPVEARFFGLYGTVNSTTSIFQTVFVQNANTQTLSIAAPGCFPSSLFNSLGIKSC